MGKRASHWPAWAVILTVVGLGVGLMLVQILDAVAKLETRNWWVDHTHQVITQTREIQLSASQAESATRGYLVVRDESYLGPYRVAEADLPKMQLALESLVSDRPDQISKAKQLEDAVKAKLNWLSLLIEYRRNHDASAVEARGVRAEGAADMELVNKLAAEICGREELLLTARMDQVTESRNHIVATAVTTIFTLGALILAAAFMSHTFAVQQKRYSDLVKSIGDTFYFVDRKWRVQYFNRVAEQTFGKSADDVLGKSFWEVFPEKLGTSLEAHYREAMQLGRTQVFTAISPTLGRSFEYRIFPSEDGLGVILQDVTARLRAEAEIRELNESLEKRVLDRTAQLEGFCYSIAHDMRMHIRGVSTNVALLAEELADGRSDVSRNVQRLKQSTEQMGKLVDDLLVFARTSSQEMSKKTIDLSILAAEIVERVKSEAPYARDVAFEIHPNLMTTADPQLAGVVLENLIDNAGKYRKPEGPASVELDQVNVDGRLVFCIRDNGVGFDQKYADLVFKPFERLHSDSSIPGNGIGLANVQRILARHGGTIWVESTPGEGSTFYFTFSGLEDADSAQQSSALLA